MLPRIAEQWGFESELELPGGHCSRVFANATHVLKVPFQGEEKVTGWVAALKMSGTIGPRVDRSDPATGCLLMERILPGTPLSRSGLDEDACRAVVLGFRDSIAQLDPSGLMPVSDFVDVRHPLAGALLLTTTEEVFLHGDLHHDNILQGPNGWVVIDPKGLVGDPAFELSAFVRNPLHEVRARVDRVEFLEARIRHLARETGFDPWRIWGWSLLALGSPFEGEGRDPITVALQALWSSFR